MRINKKLIKHHNVFIDQNKNHFLKKKINLEKISTKSVQLVSLEMDFLIPIYVDSNNRLENLFLTLSYLNNNFKTNVIICEQKSALVKKSLDNSNFSNLKISYIQTPNRKDDLIHRTKQINEMVKISKSKIVCIYDVDVIFEREKYISCFELIKNESYDFVVAFDKKCFNINQNIAKSIIKKNSFLSVRTNKLSVLTSDGLGGAVFVNKEKYITCGMENENFISWGPEDRERYHRFNKLGFKTFRFPGNIYHISHIRTINSHSGNPFFEKNWQEFSKICKMSTKVLKIYISRWSWL